MKRSKNMAKASAVFAGVTGLLMLGLAHADSTHSHADHGPEDGHSAPSSDRNQNYYPYTDEARGVRTRSNAQGFAQARSVSISVDFTVDNGVDPQVRALYNSKCRNAIREEMIEDGFIIQDDPSAWSDADISIEGNLLTELSTARYKEISTSVFTAIDGDGDDDFDDDADIRQEEIKTEKVLDQDAEWKDATASYRYRTVVKPSRNDPSTWMIVADNSDTESGDDLVELCQDIASEVISESEDVLETHKFLTELQ